MGARYYRSGSGECALGVDVANGCQSGPQNSLLLGVLAMQLYIYTTRFPK
jgi:hypothetical protein